MAVVGLLGIAYGADYCVFRYRLATKRQPFGSVTVEHYYEVAHKDGKAEIIFDPPVKKDLRVQPFPTLWRSSVLVSRPACRAEDRHLTSTGRVAGVRLCSPGGPLQRSQSHAHRGGFCRRMPDT